MHRPGNSILKIGGLLVALLLFVTGTALGADRIDGSCARDRVLVKFHETPQGAALSAFGRNHKLLLRRVIPRIAVHRFSISDGQSLSDVIEKLSADPRVAFAEPDYIRWPTYTPNDPLFPLQWDMTLMALPSVWDFGIGSSNVVTAVVDTGIELAHPDLVNQLWLNSDEIPGNGFDDDFNGYVDDVVGYDFAGNGWFPGPGAEDPVPNDDFVGHGTHVAGTIGAQQDNGVGISGVAPGTKLMAVRVLGGVLGMGFSSDVAEGVVYATDNGANVINMSLGGTRPGLTEYLALKHAWDNNVFIAAASGNGGDSGNPVSYPAGFSFTMSVGATDNLNNIASFSTHNIFVEVSAPGVSILSTVPVGTYEGGSGWSGTSMATPHIAGLAALLYSAYPGIENWEVRSMIQSAVVDLGPAGWDEFFGHGRASAGQMIITPRPSGDTLEILTPPDGGVFPGGSVIGFLWNPVNGAVSYRLTGSVSGGGTAVINMTNSYYTHPRLLVPSGSYTVTVEALDGAGGTISSDTVSFVR